MIKLKSPKIVKQILLIFIFLNSLICLGQYTGEAFTPVTTNTPLFNNYDDAFLLGTTIDNYGLNHHAAWQFKNTIVLCSIRYNTGEIKFNPLHINNYAGSVYNPSPQSSKMFYSEFGGGHNFKHPTQILTLIGGIGIGNKITNYFFQFDWGNNGGLIDAGISVRGNYAYYNNRFTFNLQPVIVGKINLFDLRLVHQFGYSIPEAQPIITFGLEYFLQNESSLK